MAVSKAPSRSSRRPARRARFLGSPPPAGPPYCAVSRRPASATAAPSGPAVAGAGPASRQRVRTAAAAAWRAAGPARARSSQARAYAYIRGRDVISHCYLFLL